MRDFPLFATDAGIASLTLREIPYTGSAYIRLQKLSDPEQLLNECVDFCVAAGAEHIYATGHTVTEEYPFHTAILQMSRLREGLPETDAALFPLQKSTLEQWRGIYNEKMCSIPNAATMTLTEAEKLLARGNGYFVHRGQKLLGLGIAAGETVDALVATVPGAGQDVLLALSHALTGGRIIVEVASTNTRAVKLYQRLGFVCTQELSAWYQIV